MNYKENKEIMDLVKSIKEINQQIVNPDNNIRKVIADAQQQVKKESLILENTLAIKNNAGITSIENIDVNVLYNRLIDYKVLCINKLKEKCEKEVFDEIIKENNL